MAKIKPQNIEELKALVDDESVYLGDIDISNITLMDCLFKDSQRRDFKGIETWDTSNVVSMNGMFYNAIYFNHNISTWDTSSVVNMFGMFFEAKSFNQPLDKWDTSSVEFMTAMFMDAKSFNQDLDAWDVSSVRDNQKMFWESGIRAVPRWYKKRILYDLETESELLDDELNKSRAKALAHPLSQEEKQRRKQERQKKKQKSLLSKVIIGFVLVLIVIYVFSGTDESPQNEVVENSQPKTQSTTQQSEKRVFEDSQRANVENKPNLQSEVKSEAKAQNELNAASEAKNEAQVQSETTSKMTNEPSQNPAQSSVKPSFDCNKASTTTERLVCSDDELASLDLQLANAYKNARNSADIAGKKKILNEQKIWLKAYNLCNDKDCVKQNLEQRIKDLNQMSGVR